MRPMYNNYRLMLFLIIIDITFVKKYCYMIMSN